MGPDGLGGPVGARGPDGDILPGPHLMVDALCDSSALDWHRSEEGTWQYRSSRGEPIEIEVSRPENGTGSGFRLQPKLP